MSAFAGSGLFYIFGVSTGDAHSSDNNNLRRHTLAGWNWPYGRNRGPLPMCGFFYVMEKINIEELLIGVTIYKFPRFYKQYHYYEREDRLEKAYILLFILNNELAKNVLYMNDHKGHLTVAAHYFKDDAKKHIERVWELCGELDVNTSFYSIDIETR